MILLGYPIYVEHTDRLHRRHWKVKNTSLSAALGTCWVTLLTSETLELWLSSANNSLKHICSHLNQCFSMSTIKGEFDAISYPSKPAPKIAKEEFFAFRCVWVYRATLVIDNLAHWASLWLRPHLMQCFLPLMFLERSLIYSP